MTKEQAFKYANNMRATIEDGAHKLKGAPNFTEYRKNLAPECLTLDFIKFAAIFEPTGLEIRNIFSIYSKIKLVSPEFVELYKATGPIIIRPVTGEWNLKDLVLFHYNVPGINAVYRIIEQEKIPDSYGTARSGFEALQAVFVKGTVLGQKSDRGDYTNTGIIYENKGESGRLIGQDRLFSEDYKRALTDMCTIFKTGSWPQALRKCSDNRDMLAGWLIKIFESVYKDVQPPMVATLTDIYNELIKEIPEYYEVIDYKPYCIKRATKWLEAQWEVKRIKSLKYVSCEFREKECLNFVLGLFELYIYQQHSGFNILDLCEASTGRILSLDMRNVNLRTLAKQLWGKVRFYGSVAGGTRDGAHQIGFKY